MMSIQTKGGVQSLWLCLFLFLFLYGDNFVLKVDGAAGNMGEKCGSLFNKVTACLGFATGKAATPSKECCTAATEIRETDPECLCFIIQQIHNGSEQLKSLGVQESKLLQLPSACNVKNANISDCPKLLGLAANSPDAAVFTNASSATPTTNAVAAATSPSKNSGSKLPGPQMIISTGLVAMAAAIFQTGYGCGWLGHL